MKNCLLLLGLILSTCLSAQNYIDTTYTITTETNIEYGSSVNFAGVQKTLEMDISYPTDDVVPSCGRPLALIIHGGAWAEGSKEDGNIVRMRKDFAKRGYVTAAINYRLGYFHTDLNKHCNVENWDCLNLADSSEWIRAWYRGVQDAKGALRYLIENKSTYEIDASNVFVFGESAGAFISIGVAYMDQETEKPLSCNGLNSVNPPHSNLYTTCIQGTTFDIPIANMDLSRPDLGSIHGNMNPSSEPYIIKGVGSFYGGLFTDLFTEKSYFDVPKLYLYHQPNDLIVPFNANGILAGLNSCAVNSGGCAQINDRPLTYGGFGINNMIDTLSINPLNKPEIRAEFTTNSAPCAQQVFDPSTGGHQFDSYWNRTVSMADFFAQGIGPNDCASLSLGINKLNSTIIYPNPTNDLFSISHNSDNVDISLFDAQGKLLKKQSRIENGSSISIGDLNNGVYYLKVNSDIQSTTHKIIKSDK
jgi:alpha/beta superfamily hydrolase